MSAPILKTGRDRSREASHCLLWGGILSPAEHLQSPFSPTRQQPCCKGARRSPEKPVQERYSGETHSFPFSGKKNRCGLPKRQASTVPSCGWCFLTLHKYRFPLHWTSPRPEHSLICPEPLCERKTTTDFPLLSHYTIKTEDFYDQMCGFFSPHAKQAISFAMDTSWVSSSLILTLPTPK